MICVMEWEQGLPTVFEADEHAGELRCLVFTRLTATFSLKMDAKLLCRNFIRISSGSHTPDEHAMIAPKWSNYYEQ